MIYAYGISEEGWIPVNSGSCIAIGVEIVLDHISLAAANPGLGTDLAASFDFQTSRELLKFPSNIEPIALMDPVYAADVPAENE